MVEPFLGAGVAVVVFEERDAEHFHFRIIPAVDHVERVAAAGNMIDHGRLLGGDDRMIERDMRGRDHAGIFGRAGNAGRPGEGLEARPLRIGRAAKAAPARHRHQRLEFHVVGELGQRHGIRPGDFEPAVEVRHHAAGIEIGLKRAELELAAAQRRIDLAAVALAMCTCIPIEVRCAYAAQTPGPSPFEARPSAEHLRVRLSGYLPPRCTRRAR